MEAALDTEEPTPSGFFPSINQFRNVVKAERDWAAYHNVAPRVRTFRGTVKLHGTNAGITLTPEGELIYRSRSRVITVEDDNCGFARHMLAHEGALRGMMRNGDTVFGEWCGQGIQKGVGISSMPKMFVLFALRVGDIWLDPKIVGNAPESRIFNIRDFPSWEMEIDFSKPEQAQNELCAITEKVEAVCPIALSFGHEGIGEGVVWIPVDGDMDSRYWFKVKGEKHSVSKVRTLAAVDVEHYARQDELIAGLITENRLKQGLDLHVNEFGRAVDMKSIGEYLRWVFNDVAKEESDTIAAAGFELKELGKGISDVAKRFYIDAVNKGEFQ